MAAETVPAVPGRLIGGRYRLDAELGSGGFGRVWRGWDTSLDRVVAVKEVWMPATSPADRAERLARAGREARTAAALADHPNIVTVHDVVVEDEAPWIVMRYVAGVSLQTQLADRGPLPVDQVAVIARGLLSALGAAHAAGIVHRDVKPANVLLADDGGVLLTDFGIAVTDGDQALTAAGSFLGSMEYTAPERAEGRDGLPASDLFSLGATLFHAVEGTSPFHRETRTGILTALLVQPVPETVRAGRLTGLIRALLARDPADRPSVAGALAMTGEAAGGTGRATPPDTALIPDPAATAVIAAASGAAARQDAVPPPPGTPAADARPDGSTAALDSTAASAAPVPARDPSPTKPEPHPEGFATMVLRTEPAPTMASGLPASGDGMETLVLKPITPTPPPPPAPAPAPVPAPPPAHAPRTSTAPPTVSAAIPPPPPPAFGPPRAPWPVPPMAPYPVPPARKRNPAPIIVSVAVAVILVVVAVIALGGRHGDSVGNAGAGQTSSAPDQANQPTAPAMSFPSYNPPSRGSDGSVPASDSPAAPSSSDLMAGAQVGDCFYDNGTGVNADLATASCGPGTWQVVQINDDTTSLASCDNVKDSNESVSSSRDNLVLCLSYLSPGGTAYHAHVGDCVYGPNSPSSVWDKQSCQTGNFTVIARIPGTTDTGKCNAEGVWDESETFTVDKSSTMDLVLCLTMNWPDAAGSAQQNACLLKTGTDSAPVFKHVSSCSQANVVVTGRTSTYDDPSFCGNDGAAWWKSSDFPKIAYTVCWRWK